MSLNITHASARQRLNPTPLTLIGTGGSGGSSLSLVYEFLGDSKLSFVCKRFHDVGHKAMANLTYSLLNNGLCLKIRILRNIRLLRIDSFASPREYVNRVEKVLVSALLEEERLLIEKKT